MKVYIAGPMTGIPQFNYPAFDAAAKDLRERGFEVVSPAEMDDPETRKAALASPDGAPGSGTTNGETWGDFLARDVKLVSDQVEGIVCLPGWEKSRGARLETFVARLCDRPIYRYPDLGLIDAAPVHGPVPTGYEVRVTNAKTGGEKGSKPQRFDLIPWEAVAQIAEVYGFGAQKYAAHNWRKGYDWGLSIAALFRHLTAFTSGEDTDPESGLPHLAHAGFHIFGLLTFAAHDRYADLDDRYREED